jgi:hypothetical protein
METKNCKPQLFKPGEGGRPKGALNKISQERKEKIEMVLELADELVEEALRKLKPKELLDIWIGLQEYVCPKLQRVTLDTEPEDNKITKITFEVVPAGRPSV